MQECLHGTVLKAYAQGEPNPSGKGSRKCLSVRCESCEKEAEEMLASASEIIDLTPEGKDEGIKEEELAKLESCLQTGRFDRIPSSLLERMARENKRLKKANEKLREALKKNA